MKRILIILYVLLHSFVSYAQSMYSDAVTAMNNGEYADAKVYWMALNDSRNSYGSRIKTCDLCIDLQNKAKAYMDSKRYSMAIKMYQEILGYNPYDQSAKTMMLKCQRLYEEYRAANEIKTYTNQTFGYSIKHPAYLIRYSMSTSEDVVFRSADNKLNLNITAVQKDFKKTNAQILNDVVNSYSPYKVTYKVIKQDWVVISGYLEDGRIFYNKSIITTRSSQYNEPVTVLVSAQLISYKNDARGNTLSDLISKDFVVDEKGPVVQVKETDKERWARTKKLDTKEAYTKYITYAPSFSPYLTEAKTRITLCMARESYDKQDYIAAKIGYEAAEQYMNEADKLKLEECYYLYCTFYYRSLSNLRLLKNKYPNHPKMNVINGCFVKEYCELGMYKEAKEYVKSHYNMWFSERTYYSEKQWLLYIKTEKKKAKKAR